jgi:hypothetical protein
LQVEDDEGGRARRPGVGQILARRLRAGEDDQRIVNARRVERVPHEEHIVLIILEQQDGRDASLEHAGLIIVTWTATIGAACIGHNDFVVKQIRCAAILASRRR